MYGRNISLSRSRVMSRKFTIFRFVLIVIDSPSSLNCFVMFFLILSACGPEMFSYAARPSSRYSPIFPLITAFSDNLFSMYRPTKRASHNLFDVTMGSYDGAEICELVGLYMLNKLSEKAVIKGNIGLYRDDGLAAYENISGPQAERIKKNITKQFKDEGLSITIKTNLKIVNFLDITLDLDKDIFRPYIKPNDRPLYINVHSNHPPPIIRQLPEAVNRRISQLSHNEEAFNNAKPCYEEALHASGFNHRMSYETMSTNTNRRNRTRKIIWYNPPFNKSLKTNIGNKFLSLVEKHFPKDHRLHKIFNKNTIKVSYSCTQNMANIIKSHNNRILNPRNKNTHENCNCNTKEQCPLQNKCLVTNVVYEAHITTNDDPQGRDYIGLTEGTFKKRFTQHKSSFNNIDYSNKTSLSKYVWSLKNEEKEYKICWSSIDTAKAYNNGSNKCGLCLCEKLAILKGRNARLLNTRDELISKCRHENKFYIQNYKNEIT